MHFWENGVKLSRLARRRVLAANASVWRFLSSVFGPDVGPTSIHAHATGECPLLIQAETFRFIDERDTKPSGAGPTLGALATRPKPSKGMRSGEPQGSLLHL